jgi:hypothetical protein
VYVNKPYTKRTYAEPASRRIGRPRNQDGLRPRTSKRDPSFEAGGFDPFERHRADIELMASAVMNLQRNILTR